MTQQKAGERKELKPVRKQNREAFANILGQGQHLATNATPPADLSQASVQRSFANPRALSSNEILQLQRTAGNQAVQRMLNPPQSQAAIPKKKPTPADESIQPVAPQPSFHATPDAFVQRKMAFATSQLSTTKSTKAKMSESLSKRGLGNYKTIFERIRAMLSDYAKTQSANEEARLLELMLALANNWLKSNSGGSSTEVKSKTKNLTNLVTAIKAELPKAKEQQAYINDLSGNNTGNVPGAPAKTTSKFQFLSGPGKHHPVEHANALIKGQTNENIPGMKQSTFDVVKKYQLTDAEIAAIKIYSIDDYKYINPTQTNKDSTLTQQQKDDWLKKNMPDIDRLDSERGGVAIVLSYANNAARVMIESGTLKENFEVNVYRDIDRGNGSQKELASRSTAVSVALENSNAPVQTGFRKGQLVVLKLANTFALQKGDKVSFADTSAAGVQQAKEEGQRHGRIVQQAMMKLPDVQHGVYRGMTISPQDLTQKYAPGQTISYGNFTSTAKDREASLKFIRREMNKEKTSGGNKVGMLLQLDLKEKGKDVSEFSLVSDEQEVLLMPGTEFKVDKRFTKPSTADVEGQRIQFYIVLAKQITEKEKQGAAP